MKFSGLLLLALALLTFDGWCKGRGNGKTAVLQIKELKSLDFGVIQAGGVSGSVSVSPSYPPLVLTTGGVYAFSQGHQQPTRLKVKGEANNLIYLNLQNQTILTSEQGRQLDLHLQLNSSLRHLGPSGVLTDVFIGGTLNIGANPSAGDYQGVFSITVDYQ